MDIEVFDARLKERLLRVLRFTIDFLNEHNLRWWVCGGTLIGAVRHHNIIPWDDDIDILMPRADYNRLISLKNELKHSGYTLMSTDINYYNVFAKICDDGSTLLDTVTTPYLMGVFVDIFPLDQCDLSSFEYEKEYKQYFKRLKRFHRSFIHYSWRALKLDLRYHHPNAILNGISSFLFNSTRQKKKYYSSFLEVEHMFDKRSGSFMVSPTGVYGAREHFPAEWFDSDLEVPFADFKVMIPSGYDAFLKHMYGDYMELPPEEKRVTHHSHYYFNLNERVSMDVALDSAAKGIHYIF